MVKPAYALLEEMLVTKNRFSSMEEKVIKIYVEKSGTVKVNNIFLAISSWLNPNRKQFGVSASYSNWRFSSVFGVLVMRKRLFTFFCIVILPLKYGPKCLVSLV